MARAPWTIDRAMFLNEAEVERLLLSLSREAASSSEDAHVHTSLDRLVVEVLLFSGMRTSEFCALRLADASLSIEPVLHVRRATREERSIHIPRSVARLISSYVKEKRPQLLPRSAKRDDRKQPLFLHERGRPFERSGLYRRVVRILSNAGLADRASVQLLRHTYGYLAYKRSGGNLLFVQRQLGHSHPMVTSIYSQFVQENYADMADRVAEELFSVDQDRARSSKKELFREI